MARDHARLLSSAWGDSDWKALQSDQQRLYWLITSQPDLSLAGVANYSPRRWSQYAADTNVAGIKRTIRALVERHYLLVDENTDEVWVRSFVRHDGVLKVPNIAVGMVKAYRTIVSKRIQDAFRVELLRLANEPEFINLPAWERPVVAELLAEAAR